MRLFEAGAVALVIMLVLASVGILIEKDKREKRRQKIFIEQRVKHPVQQPEIP